MNCLQYALKFWDENPKYKIFYDGDHVINLTEKLGNYIPIEEYGYNHLKNSFNLSPVDLVKLKRYFDEKNINHTHSSDSTFLQDANSVR